MKINILRIGDENLRDDEREYDMNYSSLIMNKTLELRKDGRLVVEDIVTELYQDNFDFLRITTKSGDKFRISPSKDVDLEKDLKTQQVKDVFNELNKKHSLIISVKDERFVITKMGSNIINETSEDNESLEDFILRVGKTIINNK